MSLNSCRKLKIAIDGPAGAGKSTVAREVAHRLQIKYLDTGAMYRAVTLKFIRENTPLDDLGQVEAVLQRTSLDLKSGRQIFLDGEDVTAEIRQPHVNNLVSPVSAIPAVRRRMVELQQEIAFHSEGIIMDGRDIASRVMPHADFRFYLDASLEERARRRLKEQFERGLDLSLEAVAAEIEARDRIDSGRADSPLTVTPGAIVIDTTAMTFDQVVQTIMNEIMGENCTSHRDTQMD
jgi:cytidylate kinase